MKTAIIVLAAIAAITTPSFSMGWAFKESVQSEVDLSGNEVQTPVAVPTSEALAQVAAIDMAGDALGAAGVPVAGMAGEIAYGVLALLGIMQTARLKLRDKALGTMSRGVERGTSDGTIKGEILRQSVKDGTTAIIQKAVKRAT